jgi:hypothetical protein
VTARLTGSVVAVVVVIATVGCEGGGPTTPTGAPRPEEPYEVSGVVTDDQGAPVGGAYVTMARVEARPSVLTDASGAYRIDFRASPRVNPGTGLGFLARAEIVADGYEQYWRNVMATNPPLVEHFRLHRINRITAGDSMLVSVTPDNGDCQGWLSGPCGRVRIAAPSDGNLRIEAVPTQNGASLPQLEVWSEGPYGNPLSLAVKAGTEVRVEIGQPGTGSQPAFTTGESVMVKTSFEPL